MTAIKDGTVSSEQSTHAVSQVELWVDGVSAGAVEMTSPKTWSKTIKGLGVGAHSLIARSSDGEFSSSPRRLTRSPSQPGFEDFEQEELRDLPVGSGVRFGSGLVATLLVGDEVRGYHTSVAHHLYTTTKISVVGASTVKFDLPGEFSSLEFVVMNLHGLQTVVEYFATDGSLIASHEVPPNPDNDRVIQRFNSQDRKIASFIIAGAREPEVKDTGYSLDDFKWY